MRRLPPSPQNPEPPGQPSVTVLGSKEVQSIVGSEIRSAADEDMGRIVDVLVDGAGQPARGDHRFSAASSASAAARSRWSGRRWHFVPAASARYRIVLELTKDQVKPAPEFKDGKAHHRAGTSGSLEPLP